MIVLSSEFPALSPLLLHQRQYIGPGTFFLGIIQRLNDGPNRSADNRTQNFRLRWVRAGKAEPRSPGARFFVLGVGIEEQGLVRSHYCIRTSSLPGCVPVDHVLQLGFKPFNFVDSFSNSIKEWGLGFYPLADKKCRGFGSAFKDSGLDQLV